MNLDRTPTWRSQLDLRRLLSHVTDLVVNGLCRSGCVNAGFETMLRNLHFNS